MMIIIIFFLYYIYNEVLCSPGVHERERERESRRITMKERKNDQAFNFHFSLFTLLTKFPGVRSTKLRKSSTFLDVRF